MLNRLTQQLDFDGRALSLRAERQRVLASNIANVDTPGYKARDFSFSQAMQQATSQTQPLTAQILQAAAPTTTHPAHIPLAPLSELTQDSKTLIYAQPSQASADSNTVDLDRERANFADNSIRYESTLRFISGGVRTMLSAITGQ